jgi:aspartyl-tRNA(Asn)/glutamyl-tRNA(Gln) amidotransferase subunit B
VVQETRLYDPDKNETRSMRSKEDAQDYRYFPDPDLLPLLISEEQIERIRSEMPILPEVKRKTYVDLGLTPYQADILTSSREMTDYSDATFMGTSLFTGLANWITGPLSARLNEENLDISKSRVPPEALRSLETRVADGTLSGKMAKEVFDAMWAGEGSADEIIEKRGLKQISDSGAVEKIVDEVMVASAKLVEDYRSGKEKAFNALVGQVMKASKGKANPAQVNEILRRKLKG